MEMDRGGACGGDGRQRWQSVDGMDGVLLELRYRFAFSWSNDCPTIQLGSQVLQAG
jgi:hypothetical protein